MSEPISSLGSSQLLELVRRGELDEPQILEVLRNPYCTVEIAQVVADTRLWMTSYKVRERLAGKEGLPFQRTASLLATLPWLSLLLLSQQPSTPPLVRRHAEKRLLQKVEKMTLGEKVALARRAHRPLFAKLVSTNDGHVLQALLDNPRLVENTILVILNTAAAPVEFYPALVRHPRWGQCYAVRQALAACPVTPLPIALSALVQLKRLDLEELATRPGVLDEVRSAARALAERKKLERRPSRSPKR